ncbi:hypothetical protein ASE01_08070 [Nocardioides sp. Root190]|uniref:DUF7224 domain-containing protein n=1 Tax=Nocardioides sp. Root190 TaxID=1736488 RepID=UPI0006FF3B62|nr:hypothetical protein [Nocardioides sp. Root190]KRB78104.1 hypothetical protein ASE01_08070 [Nocardioides sp. Root190]
MAGLGIAVVVLAAAHPPMAWATWSRRVVVVAGGAALVTGWVMVSNDNDSRYELVADPAVTCAGSAPQVCVFAETPRPLKDLAEQVRRQAEPLREAGVDLPGRFVQSYAGHRDGSVDGVVSLSVGEETGRTVDAASATQTLVTPAACPQDWSDLPSEEAFDARHLLGRWLQVRSGLRTPGADDSDGAWLTGDLGEQAAWVRTTYRLLRTCDFERIQMPDGVG